ncbi:hypothetical protein [Actinomadura madurae]|nr:hypothetical protein [Actinomadura madurae]
MRFRAPSAAFSGGCVEGFTAFSAGASAPVIWSVTMPEPPSIASAWPRR